MEGIQHRWDCPARKHVHPRDVVVVVAHTEHRRCQYCHRAATVEIRHPVGDPPVFELDDEYELDETTGQFRRITGGNP